MIWRKSTVKLLTLCAIATTMALGASPAYGELFSDWYVSGSAIGNFLDPVIETKEVEGGTASLLTTVGGKNVRFSCTGVKLVGGNLEIFGNGSITAVEFHGCATYQEEKLLKACEPFVDLYNEKGEFVSKAKGLIISMGLDALIVLHEGKGVVRIEPENVEKRFATIDLGEECSISEKLSVFGKLYLQDNEFTTSKVDHLFTQLSSLTALTVLGKSASIDGSIVVRLGSEHVGLKWNGLPN